MGADELVSSMLFSSDMREFIEILDRHRVVYALIGGYAVNYYGYVRTTQDIDLFIYPSRRNAKKIMLALEDFGFAGAGIPKEFFEKPGSAIHLGVEPNRIDLITGMTGVEIEHVFQNTHLLGRPH